MRCFVEDMAVHLAAASLEVGSTSESAKLLLVSLMGSLSVVLRSRRASSDGKVTCLKIVGRITQQLKGDDSEEMLCQSCRESQETCLACQAPGTVEDPSGGTRSRDHSCRRNQTAMEDASFEEGCDLCLVRWAANEMAEQSGKSRGPELELWPARFLLVESWRDGATPEADLLRDAGRLLQLTLWAEEKMPPGAAELLQQGHDWLAGTKSSLLRAQRGWNGASAEAFQRPLRRLQRLGAQRLVRNLTSAVLAQSRSPQAHVRASALRALQSAPPQGFKLSRSALQEALSKDPSASVRAAAIPLISSMGQDGKGHWDSWSLGLLRAAAAREDDSTTVRLGSCRVLAQALRGGELLKAAEICCEVAVHMNSLWTHTSAGGIMDDLQHFIFDDVESKGRGALLLEALASAHRLGAEQLLPVALKALKKSEANYQCKVQALAKALVDAFANAPAACGAALQALSAAAPWAMVEHVRAMSIYLAMGVPPTADEEVRALSVCAALGNTLAEHKSPGKVLSPWAWARLHDLCASQSSRLVRPAMRCLCLAAQAEDNLSPILRHLRPALQLLRAQLEASQPTASHGNLLRAAWMAACACEFCDLNKMASPSDLGLLATTAMPSEKRGMLKRNRRDDRLVGTSIARDLLRIFQVFAGSEGRAPLPALVMPVGFALKRHWHLVGSEDFDKVISSGLGATGQDLLAERSLEVLASLCDHLSRESEEGKDGCTAVLSKLTRHLPAVLRFARHGLHRRAEPGDVALRRMAVTAARALHRAGLGGNPAALGAVAMTSLFDRSLRHNAQLLLTALARKDPQALAQSQGQGLREAFAALLWQAPHQLAPSARSLGISSAAASAGKSFTLCGRVARGKWLRLVLGELTNTFAEGHFPPLPAEPGAGASRRLGPFGASPVKDWTDSWPRVARLQLLYSHFLAQILCALPLSAVAPAPGQAEVEIVTQECRKFLELRCAAASSALEHEGSMSDSTLATCILSMVVKALLVALPWPEHLERLSALQSALCSESLRQVAQGDAAVAERCFQDAQGADAAKSPKKRRAPKRGGERPRKQRRAVRKAHEGSS